MSTWLSKCRSLAMQEVSVVVRSQRRESAWTRMRRAVRQARSDYRSLRRRRTSEAAAVAIVATDARERATADILRIASSPHVLTDDSSAATAAAAALIARWPPQQAAGACDVLLMTADSSAAFDEDATTETRVVVVADTAGLRALLREAANDAHCRMRLASDAAATSLASGPGTSALRTSPSDITAALETLRVVQVEAEVCGLAPRHACYLTLEAVLRDHTSEPQLGPLVSVLHRAAATGPTGASAINGVLEVLTATGLCSQAPAVLGILISGGRILEAALLEWDASAASTVDGEGAAPRATAGLERYRAALRPLLPTVGGAPPGVMRGGGGGVDGKLE